MMPVFRHVLTAEDSVVSVILMWCLLEIYSSWRVIHSSYYRVFSDGNSGD